MTGDTRHKLALVGAGKMGGALVRALIAREVLKPEDIIAADVQEPARDALAASCPGVATTAEAAHAAQGAAVLLIAVKPQDFDAALAPVVGARPPEQLIVSVMAGVPIRRLAGLFGDQTPIIRVMPNIVCEVYEGAFGYAAGPHVTGGQKAMLDLWLNSIGVAEEFAEELLDAVTGLSGSGPAFAALFIDALADGAVAAGMTRAKAQRLAAQTVLGAARWVLKEGHPADLKEKVASPGGTTIAGLRELEARGLRSAVMEAVVAAARRAGELGD